VSKYAELFSGPGGTATAPPRGADPVKEPAGAAGPFTLLFVDDEDSVLSALRRIFLEENYEILTAGDAACALEILEKTAVHLIVSDHRMPGMSGAEFLRAVRDRWPETIRIMLTGYADVQSILGAVNEGAVYKFITKPWNDEDLRLTVSLALQQYLLLQENRRLREITKVQQQKIKNYSALFEEDPAVSGNILVRVGAATRDGVRQACEDRRPGETLVDTLVRRGVGSESAILHQLSEFLQVPVVDLQELGVNAEVAKFLPRDLCDRKRMVPVRLEGRQVFIAMADPSDVFRCNELELLTGFKVVPFLARGQEIAAVLRKVYGQEEGDPSPGIVFDLPPADGPIDEIDIVLDDDKPVNIQEMVGESRVAPIIRITNAIISEAVRHRASDIHIEPKTKCTLVRFRIDGILHPKLHLPPDLHAATVSRFKILAKMDIAERRRPQDGRITVKAGTRVVDIRVSTMPTINGEKAVMRILDKQAAIRTIDELGISGHDLARLKVLIRKPQGIFISTGPTGSGKTTMLYSILSAMLESIRSFETIEDPVEYFLEEANQVHVHDKAGLSFASVLRATMRQDPDVILVGEVRDAETADVAFKASLTGHMVLTSLHTNSSVASITRLIDMGVKPYLIASAVEGILAQRLVRTICTHCRVEEPVDPELLSLLNVGSQETGETVSRGKGCARCNQTGYLGRTGLFELFVMDDGFRELVSSNYREPELVAAARAAGMHTLLEDGLAKVRGGVTTIDEVLRVIGPQKRHERACSACGRMVDVRYYFCPFCGRFRQHTCRKCKIALEPGWTTCPHCGDAAESGG
jgi:type II secretory ATPase GspE/PulE/Tfp pilus assembly ATPase PilB-like protein/FixJ family two-component response regulator/RNA polymerase subunit RPABC4/transcription elongation factor Spt4